MSFTLLKCCLRFPQLPVKVIFGLKLFEHLIFFPNARKAIVLQDYHEIPMLFTAQFNNWSVGQESIKQHHDGRRKGRA